METKKKSLIDEKIEGSYHTGMRKVPLYKNYLFYHRGNITPIIPLIQYFVLKELVKNG